MAEAKRGRPFSESPKTTRLEIRVTPEQKQEVMEAAKASGLSMYELLRIGMETVQQRNAPSELVISDSDAILQQIVEVIREHGIL